MNNCDNKLAKQEELNEEELLKYLEGKLTYEEQHAFEFKMNSSDFINEAIEGLQQISTPKKISKIARQLNKQLHQNTKNNKKRILRTKAGLQEWILIAVLSIIFLCSAGYLLIHFYSRG